jgi:hypothetical protein
MRNCVGDLGPDAFFLEHKAEFAAVRHVLLEERLLIRQAKCVRAERAQWGARVARGLVLGDMSMMPSESRIIGADRV